MTNETERPLVTFALFAYNQERYIREAVDAALAQDYSPLEIIFSDDCSSDRTFEIMQEMVGKYSGPHDVKLNRNSSNLGIGSHINALMDMVSADFVVVAAGDDISEVNRTSELTKVWLESGRQYVSIFSSATMIDIDGNPIGISRKGSTVDKLNCLDSHASENCFVLGAAHGWDMRLIREFDPLLTTVVNEDVVLAARAALIGRICFLDKPLVRYRIGSGITYDFLRRRKQKLYEISIVRRRQRYCCWLQKSRDFRSAAALEGRKSILAKSRAMALYPIWLRTGRRTRSRVFFFLTRCDTKFMVWEWIKYRFPVLVAFKHKLGFYLRGKKEVVRV